MPIGGLEKCVPIERVDPRRDTIKQALDQIAPPAFVVVWARLPRRETDWHFLPDDREGPGELLRIEREALPVRNQGIMRADTFR